MAIKFFPVAGALAALSLVPFVLEAPAQAAACPTGASATVFPGTTIAATYATVFGGSYSCTIGDLVFSNFASPTADLAALGTKPYFWFTEDPDAMSYSISYGYASSGAGVGTFPIGPTTSPVRTYGFSYKATIDQSLAAGYGFSGYSAGRTGTNPSATTPSGNPNFQQTLDGTPVNFYTMNFTTSARLAGTVASNTRILYNEFTQAPVPGPLPLVGAGVAFGFSRKIRRRALKAA
ncbi:MAG: hypothetical protein ACK5N0_13110 [Synechococcaceae cyanobacterium]